MAQDKSTRTILFLAVGAAVGLVLAASGAVERLTPWADTLPDGVVASINGTPLYTDTFETYLDSIRADNRNPLLEQDVDFILERLIEEELLVQRGLEIDLAQSDRAVRTAMTQAMINSIVADSQAQAVDEEELKAFYADNRSFFSPAARMRVHHMRFRFDGENDELDARARADQARERLLGGEPFAAVAHRFGDPIIAPVPDVLLPVLKLREYIGPLLVKALSDLKTGEFSPVLRSGKAFHLIELVEREETDAVPFDQMRSRVEMEYRRRRDDAALKDYLVFLRDRADIRRALPTDNGTMK